MLPTLVTNSWLEKAAISARANNTADGTTLSQKDWWGNPIKIRSGPNADKTVYAYMALSAGQDGKFDTADDLHKIKIDLNKSKIAGKYMAKKSRELLKGWKEGLKEKSKFD